MENKQSPYKTQTDYILLLLSRGFGEKNLNAGLPDGLLIKSLIEQFDRVAANPKIYPGNSDINLDTRGIFRRKSDLGFLPADLDIIDFKFRFNYNNTDHSLSLVELQADMQSYTLSFPLRNGLDLPKPTEVHDILLQRNLLSEQNFNPDLPKINLDMGRQRIIDIKHILVERGYIPSPIDSIHTWHPSFKELDYKFKKAYDSVRLNEPQRFDFKIKTISPQKDEMSFLFAFTYDALNRKVNINSIEASYKDQKILTVVEGIKDIPTLDSFRQKFDELNRYTKANKIANTTPEQSTLRVIK